MLNLLPKEFLQAIESKTSSVIQNSKNDDYWLIPPVVDLCARLGDEWQLHGTLTEEATTARKNGFLHVVVPPDSKTVLENSSVIKDLREHAYQNSGIHLHVLGALTEGLIGKRPANVAGMKKNCVAVTNAGKAFSNDLVMLRTLEYAATFGLKVFFYPDEPSLSNGGVAHEGYIASFHGLQGIPWIAETVALSKQLLMIEETGISAHFSQLTTKSSVELIRWAKQKGLPITCDVAMHQLHLTDDNLEGFNSMAFVYPPLRSNTDQQALRNGLVDGTIDAICSHHQPLSMTAKQAPFAETEPGISNLDTFIALGCKLVKQDLLTPQQLVEKVCLNPAKIAGIEEVYNQAGGAVLIDSEQEWLVSTDTMFSKGKNTPFMGQNLKGRVIEVIFDN